MTLEFIEPQLATSALLRVLGGFTKSSTTDTATILVIERRKARA
jgi:hypothetical protein